MINIKEVFKTVNSIISRNSKFFCSAIALRSDESPNYNNGMNMFKVCSLNLEICKEFYRNNSSKEIWEKECPFGLKVTKRSFDTSSSYGKISSYSIVSNNKLERFEGLLTNLPRNLKRSKEEVLLELNSINLNESEHRKNKDYIDGLLQTLLIGRIGLSIQSISHQFFTPLQGAMSDVKNIETGHDIAESVKRLTKNFNSLNKLATEIQLILSTSHEFNINMLRRVTVHSMVSDIFDSMESTATEKHILLRQGYNYGAKSVDAIPSQLNIVLSNLISNAIKYSFKGQNARPLEVIINYKDNENFLLIEVINEGCKITNEEIRERLIFNLSYRGEFSCDRQRSGSGSGLYISEMITKLHGGKIEVSSTYCGGDQKLNTDRYKNVFTLHWPIIIEN